MKESLYRLVLGGCALLAVLCLCMLSCVRERVVVSIDGFDLHAPEGVTVGRASDICFDKVPHDFLTIRRTAGGFSWQVNDRWLRSDSLCYFHINGVNPNAHKLSESQTIVVGTGPAGLFAALLGEFHQLGGGFLFAMCSAPDSYDVALAAENVDICDVMFDGDQERLLHAL